MWHFRKHIRCQYGIHPFSREHVRVLKFTNLNEPSLQLHDIRNEFGLSNLCNHHLTTPVSTTPTCVSVPVIYICMIFKKVVTWFSSVRTFHHNSNKNTVSSRKSIAKISSRSSFSGRTLRDPERDEHWALLLENIDSDNKSYPHPFQDSTWNIYTHRISLMVLERCTFENSFSEITEWTGATYHIDKLFHRWFYENTYRKNYPTLLDEYPNHDDSCSWYRFLGSVVRALYI